jgi:CheY-like chemotaxis protein
MNKQNNTILILEDERPLREVIKDKMESEGYNVISAKSVDEALGYLNSGVKVQAIWLDHYLFGNKDGLDFVTLLKKDPRAKHLPVFVVSNTVSPNKIQIYTKMGVQKVFSKVDYRLDKIIGEITEFLNKK